LVSIVLPSGIVDAQKGAMAFANHIAKHIKEEYGTTLDLLMASGGNPGRLAWRENYESLGQCLEPCPTICGGPFELR
jgi:hypothetical protein